MGKLICAFLCFMYWVHYFLFSEDIKRYRGDRFRIASEICEVVMDILEQMEPKDRDRWVGLSDCNDDLCIHHL